jgi:hypothetical protein
MSAIDPRPHSKAAQAERLLRRPSVRRVLGLTLVIAGVAMVLSGLDGAFFH